MPLLVEVISSMEDAAGAEPVVLIATCADAVVMQMLMEKINRILFIVLKFQAIWFGEERLLKSNE